MLTHMSAEAIIPLWTVLTGGPAIRVKCRPKQPNSGGRRPSSIVSGALAFTVLEGLVFVCVTERTTAPILLHPQLNIPRRWASRLLAQSLIPMPGTPSSVSLIRPWLTYLLQGLWSVQNLPSPLLLIILFPMALISSTPLGCR